MERKELSYQKDKILFSYSTLIRDGMPELDIYTPEPLINNIKKGSNHPLVVTTGLVLSDDKKMYTEVDIFFEGKGVVVGSDEPGQVNSSVIHHLPEVNKKIYLSGLYLDKVFFPGSGYYQVIVSAFIAPEDGEDEGILVDNLSSYFYVETIQEADNGSHL